MNKFTPPRLKQFAQSVYESIGVHADKAAIIADSLVQANLWNHQSHGVMRTFWYTRRMQSGATDITAMPAMIMDSGAIAVVDGLHGIG